MTGWVLGATHNAKGKVRRRPDLADEESILADVDLVVARWGEIALILLPETWMYIWTKGVGIPCSIESPMLAAMRCGDAICKSGLGRT